MTADDLSATGLAIHAAALILPFAICLALARRGHARTAWWLPGGILAMTMLFVFVGMQLGGEIQTGIGAAMTLGTIAVPAVLGGVAGILLGRRRA